MLRIIGRKTSSNVMKVLWACAELGLDYQREDLGGPFGGNDSPEYQALNPNRLVPTMVEDDFVLWESNSIVRYLAHNHGNGTLWPADARTRGNAQRWMDFTISTLAPAHVPVFHGLVRTPPDKRDAAAIAAGRDNYSAQVAILDRYLGDSEYLAGPDITMADIAPAPFVFRWFNLPIEREDLPNLRRWYDGLAARPAFAKVVLDIGLQ